MARITEEASATIFMNMEPARKEFEKWTQAVKDGEEELERLLSLPEKERNNAAIKKVEKDISKAREEASKAEDKLKTFRDSLNNLNGSSMKDLTKAAKELEAQVKRLKPGTEEYVAATHDLKMVRTRINDLKEGFKAVSAETEKSKITLKSLVGTYNHYWGAITMTISALTNVSMSFRKCAEEAAKLDDVYADVMKTTGLFHDQVEALDKELMKIDTRTSREQLLLLARDAGKLGIQGKENILGFVRAADQIQVALGEDLGEGAIRNLGKIADVLGYTKSMGIEQALLSIGSAVNAVGQASTASEAYLVEFTQRLAGVGAQAGISAADLIGFASGLDQSAMKVEMASTAFQKFLMKMFEDPAQFAAYAKMEVQEFADLLSNDANTAITTVLKALKDQDGFAAMVPIFKDMGLDGARAVSVLASMASNLDAVTEAQELANTEFAKATSLTEEYNTKNNNLQAQLEKARKEFHNASIALGQSLNPILLKSTKGITYLIKALASYGKEIKAAVISIVALTAIIKAGTIAHAAYNAVVKIGTALQATWKTITWAVRVAFFKLIGATEAATIAQQQLNAVMSASVFGIIALAVAGLTAAIVHYTKKQKEANEVAKKMDEIQERINSEYSEGAGKVQALTNIVHNNNIALDERRRALNELKQIVPDYHADLTREGQLINDNTDALGRYLENLEKVTRSKILQDEYEQATAAVLKAEKEKADAEAKKLQELVNANGDTTTIRSFTMQSSAGAYNASEITPYGQAVKDLEEKTNALTTAQEIQAEIMGRITKEYGVMQKKAGEGLSEMEKEITGVQSHYDELFDMLEYRFNGDEEAMEKERKRLEDQQNLEVEAIRKKYAAKSEVETQQSKLLSQSQYDYLKSHYDSLTKKEQEYIGVEYDLLNEEAQRVLLKRYNKLMASDQKLVDKRYQQELKAIQANQRSEQNDVNRLYFEGEITAEQHEERLRGIKMESLQAQLELAKKYGQDTTQIEASILTEQTNARKAEYDKQLKDMKACYAEEENALKLSLAAGEITRKEYDSRMLELKMQSIQERLELAKQYGQDETAILQEMLDAQLEAQKAANEEMKKLKEEAKKIAEGLRSPSEARDAEMQAQLARLDALHEAMLLSEQEYEEAVKKLRKKYADEDLEDKLGNLGKYFAIANKVSQQASDFAATLKEAETAKQEAEYQKQLTAAGDNAERREEIEAEYEQKKLDLSKKYADVEMAINIAKTIANGAQAAIKAIADNGWIAGGIIAGLIAATTAAEVATIVQQRNAVKNSSVASTGGTNGASVGQRVMTGYAEGGYTCTAASDRKAVGVVHANEYVVPAWMVRKNPVMIANLEQYRRSGSLGKSGSPAHGFTDGGYTGDAGRPAIGASASTSVDIEAAMEAALRRVMADGAIRAYLVRKDLEELDSQTARFKAKTTR